MAKIANNRILHGLLVHRTPLTRETFQLGMRLGSSAAL
uniref:Uncharacterized protein n=1 Tax=Arundo donax TaxID=35708 RepID=A0A0A9C3S3_ARUDO